MSKSNRKTNTEAQVETNVNPEVKTPEQSFDRQSFMAQHGNVKSRAIRALYKEGKEVKEIVKLLGIEYQHVRNVLMQPLGGKLPSREGVVIAPTPKEKSEPATETNSEQKTEEQEQVSEAA
jgi:signal recognition particle subunit SEC65